MKKDNIRDYATNAFYLYARIGKPTCERNIQEKHKSRTKDIIAVIDTLYYFDKNEKQYINQAIERVYFTLPKKVQKNDISDRIVKLSAEFPADESTIYRWLKEARFVFAQMRGLDISVMYAE